MERAAAVAGEQDKVAQWLAAARVPIYALLLVCWWSAPLDPFGFTPSDPPLLTLPLAAVAMLEIGAIMYPLRRADFMQRLVLTVLLGLPLVPVAESVAAAIS